MKTNIIEVFKKDGGWDIWFSNPDTRSLLGSHDIRTCFKDTLPEDRIIDRVKKAFPGYTVNLIG